MERLKGIHGITIYGPSDLSRRTAVVSFNIKGKDPFEIAAFLNKRGVESRAGCHCATLAHYYYGIDPPASCRISPYIYNSMDEISAVAHAVEDAAK